MTAPIRHQWRLNLMCAISAAGVLALDIALPMGVATGVLYVVVVLIALESDRSSFPLLVAFVCSSLTFVGLAATEDPEAAPIWLALVNRAVSIMAIWATSILGVERRRAEEALGDALDSMELRVDERTRQLARSNEKLTSEIENRRRAQERFRDLLESAPDAMIIVDARGSIALVNGATERMFGWGREQLLEQPIQKLIADDAWRDRAGRESPFSGEHVCEATQHAVELVALHRQGHELPVEINLSPLQTGSDTFISVVMRDVSLRKSMQRKLIQSHRKLVQSERLAAIGEMVAGIAHESRNALQRSSACVSMLEHRVETDEKRELLAEIADAHDDLSRLYEQVRQYAAPIQLAPQRCRLDRVVERAWKDLALAGRVGKAVLTHQRQIGNLVCQVDPFACQQIFRNILENATNVAAQVRVEVVWSEDYLAMSPALRVEFRDNGPGLTAEQQAKLFKPFFTTRTKGTGLGMAITRRLVEAQGGSIEAGPPDDSGAVITVRLPRKGTKT